MNVFVPKSSDFRSSFAVRVVGQAINFCKVSHFPHFAIPGLLSVTRYLQERHTLFLLKA